MQLALISQLRSGMRLARSVYDSQGRLLLGAGVSLRRDFITSLQRRGLEAVYVTHGELDGVDLDDVVSQEVRSAAQNAINGFATILQARVGSTVSDLLNANGSGCDPSWDLLPSIRIPPRPIASIARAATGIVEEVLNRPAVIVGLIDLRSLEDSIESTFSHCLQTAVLAVAVGRTMGLDRPSLLELATAAMLHDIGKAMIPPSIFIKPEKLTSDEWSMVRQHAALGSEVMRRTRGLQASSTAVLQHHERLDGSGYPRGVPGPELTLHGRVCAVCDVYDAMTSPRHYKAMAHPHDALSHILTNRGLLYDPQVADALARIVAPYPVATVVVLSTGETAVVRRINPHALDRPVVAAVRRPDGRPYDDYPVYDLAADDDLTITGYHLLGDD